MATEKKIVPKVTSGDAGFDDAMSKFMPKKKKKAELPSFMTPLPISTTPLRVVERYRKKFEQTSH